MVTHGRALRNRAALLGAAVLAAVLALRLPGEAVAGRMWCRYDPVTRVDGQIVDV